MTVCEKEIDGQHEKKTSLMALVGLGFWFLKDALTSNVFDAVQINSGVVGWFGLVHLVWCAHHHSNSCVNQIQD